MTEIAIHERADYHLKLVQEISDLVNQSSGLNTILHGVVNKIGDSLHFDVVSIYLWDDKENALILKSTRGLRVDPERPIRLKPQEGLTGLVYETRRPLIVMPASKHPRFKYFEEIGEEEYESFIGVPLLLQNRCLGVLVGQTRDRRTINPAEETLFQIIASRLAGLLEVADRLERLKTPSILRHDTKTYQGKGVSGGFACGKVFLLRGLFQKAQVDKLVPLSRTEEKARLKEAFSVVENELMKLIQDLRDEMILSDSEIEVFEAHLLIVQGDSLSNMMTEKLEENDLAAEIAVIEVIESIAEHFENLEDKYMRDRAQDFRDIGEKLLHELFKSSGEEEVGRGISDGSIIVASDVGPSFLATLRRGSISAIVTERGGETSHTVIIAKSLGIPAVVGVDNICNLLKPGEKILVDGKTGFVFSNPDETLISEYETIYRKQTRIRELIEKAGTESINFDLDIKLTANIGFPIDLEMAKHYKIKDVGLFRTEFAFAQFKRWPTVEEQQMVYEGVTRNFEGFVTIRTLDIGADKVLSYLDFPKEENPLLGLRAIRFSMEYLDLFRDQIRAMLLSISDGHNLRILLPLITNVWEIETARSLIEQIGREIGIKASDIPQIGIMMEVPATYYQLDDYKDLIDFISVGTNDLIQYLLAVDRNSNVVGHLYSGFHPSVIRMLHDILLKTTSLGKEISVCGELAGTPTGALGLISLGYRQLSVSPSHAPVIRYLCRGIDEDLIGRIRSNILIEKKESEIKRYLFDVVESIDESLLEVQ